MNDHFTVTIHDDNGVKQFNLHRFVKARDSLRRFIYTSSCV